MKKVIAFDLDETLGVPIIEYNSIVGFNFREGAAELLSELRVKYDLVIWTVSNRSYLDKILKFGLEKYFSKTYSWDEISCNWKDIRKIGADYLIDDSSDHKIAATKFGLSNCYIIVPAYGSMEDQSDPLLWCRMVRQQLI